MTLLKNLVYRNKFKFLRHFRAVQWTYNLVHHKNLSHLPDLYKHLGLKRSHLFTLQYENLKNIAVNDEHTENEKIDQKLINHPTFLSLSIEHQNELKKWKEQGYVHLKNFFNTDTINQMEQKTVDLWNSSKGEWRFGDRRVSSAFQDLETWNFFHQKEFKALVSMLLGQEAILLNNISFLKGDEQPIHSDSFYMTTYPIGKLIGSWTALEDIHEDAGPLSYIPGSHQLPYVTNATINNCGNFWKTGTNGDEDYIDKVKEIISQNNLTPKYHLPKKGDLLLWHANLLHGGSKIHDANKTRKSMVGHFVGKNAICYHENSQRPAFRYSAP
jgi:hypothetical protein